ncbi:MAG: hydrogenase maturation protease [Vicinamibacterales bacterium]
MRSYLIGVGNPAMSDDGIGLRVVEHLADTGLLPASVTPVVLGQDGLALLSYLAETNRRVMVVDAVRMGLEPGAWRWFRPEEVESRKPQGRASTHEDDLVRVLEMARQIGGPLPQVLILGIEPARLEPGFELSDLLRARFADYVEACLSNL